MCPLQGLSQGLADSRGSTNGCALKLTFKVHIDFVQGAPPGLLLQPEDLGHPPILSHPPTCISAQSSGPLPPPHRAWSEPSQGQVHSHSSPEPRAQSFLLQWRRPRWGAEVQRTFPRWQSRFNFYKGSCSQRRKAGAKPINFLNTPEIQIKHGLPDIATA